MLLINIPKWIILTHLLQANEPKVQFLGDETSLYGTPKEELPDPVRNGGGETGSAISSQGKTGRLKTDKLKEQILNFFQPSDNKLAMKLFGNKNALIKEKMRHKRVGNWVIHPCSNFRWVVANVNKLVWQNKIYSEKIRFVDD